MLNTIAVVTEDLMIVSMAITFCGEHVAIRLWCVVVAMAMIRMTE